MQQVAAQCMANLAAAGADSAAAVWEASFPAAWEFLLAAEAGARAHALSLTHLRSHQVGPRLARISA